MRKADLAGLILKAKRLAEEKLARSENADEFVEIAEADGFKIYITAGKTIKPIQEDMHDNSRDVFMLVLKGEIQFTFENGEKEIVRTGEFFVLPKHVRHKCVFTKMNIAIEGVYEKDL